MQGIQVLTGVAVSHSTHQQDSYVEAFFQENGRQIEQVQAMVAPVSPALLVTAEEGAIETE
jgi:hypothetical protein